MPGVSIAPGWTVEEIREAVHEYELLPYGSKGSWLAARGVTRRQIGRWRDTVFEGDLDRGLIPRESGAMSTPPGKRTAIGRQRAAERAAHEAEVARLTARVRELEETNDALGKAIGLLHAMNEHEPAASPTTPDPSDS